MKKLIPFILLCWNFVYGQEKENYFISDTAKVKKDFYSYNQHSFTDYFYPEKVVKGGNSYSYRIRRYDSGKVDTTYNRVGADYYYSWDKQTGSEIIEMPKVPKVGQVWYQSDSSWKYEIKSITGKLKTPAKNYKELVVIEALQLTGRDKTKYKKYNNYYARGLGFVGSVVKGELLVYLDELVYD